MQQGLFGRKIGMTQIFDSTGNKIPVTVIQAGPCMVVKKKLPTTDGYSGLLLGFEDTQPQPAEKDRLIKRSRHWLNRPATGLFWWAFATEEERKAAKTAQENKKKLVFEPRHAFKFLRELRLPENVVDMADVGDEIKVDLFAPGDFVDVTGTSKGRGFAGAMKRHNFKGMVATHGTHEYFRHGGAVSSNTYPGRLFPGRKMPGQLGNKRVTVQSLRVVGIDPEQNLIFIRGAIPGSKQGFVLIRKAVKKTNK